MEKNNSIINAIKRLERAGDENSKSSQKLKQAVLDFVTELFPLIATLNDVSVELPWGYRINKSPLHIPDEDERRDKASFQFVLERNCKYKPHLRIRPGFTGSEAGKEWHIMAFENGHWGFVQNTDAAQLAKDIADGWIDELIKFIETRSSASLKSIAILENAKKRL